MTKPSGIDSPIALEMKMDIPRFRGNAIIVSPQTFVVLGKDFAFYFKAKHHTRKWRLRLQHDIWAPDWRGYALFRGRYVGCYKLKKPKRTKTVKSSLDKSNDE